ncbi:LacI family DNA-binding transcriptional regulator [Paraglaciecola chathamensis]|jgi:LacI family repressor for deo operon, udp, cdd, tsx, nupC, and nupG|uniref:DNA-binding transcriptional regulator CytR n=2 Tax=Paraglaciecola chathamensis TaxID=368405 RepID=A0A8H9M5H1_9ALTE|nr:MULTISPECIES: LacI family DNA-binding transcriptional regulator [Paraglaciecola]GAC11795.1 HTH-type transcriptional repressor cytR [Paraglaciecola chathamensis S18K6]GGZ71866.1 DNA-binding transcriptional regulator CytR [Paraglaciecola oceanifecundans]
MTNIKKVSELAGVSTATVSRTLKMPDMVTARTKEKVMKAVKEAGYRPSWLATSVKTGRTNTIVVLVPNLINPFFMRIIGGIEQAAQERGFTVLLCDTQGDSKRESDYASMVLTNRADGLIQLDHSFPFNEDDAKLAETIPMVSVCERIHSDKKYPVVALDNYAASRALAHHLVSYGHTKFAVIVGQVVSQIHKDRLYGLRSVLTEENIEFDEDMIVGQSYSIENGIEGMRQLLAKPNRPSAVICFNDDIAIGAMHEIHRQGLSVPDDISVVGFDNVKVSAFMNPPLTTIDQPAYEMGRRGMEILSDVINGVPLTRSSEMLPFQLLERQSSGPAPL